MLLPPFPGSGTPIRVPAIRADDSNLGWPSEARGALHAFLSLDGRLPDTWQLLKLEEFRGPLDAFVRRAFRTRTGIPEQSTVHFAVKEVVSSCWRCLYRGDDAPEVDRFFRRHMEAVGGPAISIYDPIPGVCPWVRSLGTRNSLTRAIDRICSVGSLAEFLEAEGLAAFISRAADLAAVATAALRQGLQEDGIPLAPPPLSPSGPGSGDREP